MYRNERECGQAITTFLERPIDANSSACLKREDIHFTTKLASNSSYDRARKSITQSVKDCGLGYIDLFLLHSPYGGKKARLESWRAVEDAIDAGEVRSGGVSNFGVKHVSCPLLSRRHHIYDAFLFHFICREGGSFGVVRPISTSPQSISS